MSAQLTAKPLNKRDLEKMENAVYKYNLVDVQHMAGIVPKEYIDLPENEQKQIKSNILIYKESPTEIYDDTTLHDKYIYLDKTDIDYNLFKKSYDFLLSLSDIELECLRLYSGGAGYSALNFFHKNRNNKDEIVTRVDENAKFKNQLQELFKIDAGYVSKNIDIFELAKLRQRGESPPEKPSEETLKNNKYKLYSTYYDTMSNLFKKCPKTEKEIRVFRGVGLSRYSGQSYNISEFYGFNSTTYDPLVTLSPWFIGTDCCLLDIKIKPGVPIIWIGPISFNRNEKEILLFSETIISKISNRGRKSILSNGNIRKTTLTTYDVIVEPRTSRGLLDKWKTLSTQVVKDKESDPFKLSQQGQSRKGKRTLKQKTVRKRKSNRKTYRK